MYNHQFSGSMPVPVVASSTNLNQQQPQALPGSVPVPPYYFNQHTVFQPSVSVVPTNWQQQPQTLPVCTSTTICKSDSLHISQMQVTAMPWSPVYQGMPVADQNLYRSRHQAPGAGPSRFQRRFHQAGSPHNNHFIHASSGTIENRSTSINPGYARISANDEAGVGQVWRTPPKNPLIVDRNLTQQTQYHPYHSAYRSRQARNEAKISEKKPPKGMLISLSIQYRLFHH